MKKTIILVCIALITISLTAFGYMNWSDTNADHKVESPNYTYLQEYNFVNINNKLAESDFFYDVDSRFIKTVTKSDLHNAKSVQDIFSKEEIKGIKSFRDVNIVVLPREEKNFEKGTGDKLNTAQINLLQSTDYSADICIEAFCNKMFQETGKTEEQCFVYYMTIVPEKEAEFIGGKQALISYLKENSKDMVENTSKNKLEPGKIRFIVTKNGKIGNVILESTSGYSSIDEKMVNLIKNLPGDWGPATNLKGEKVDQELVYSFGMIGC